MENSTGFRSVQETNFENALFALSLVNIKITFEKMNEMEAKKNSKLFLKSLSHAINLFKKDLSEVTYLKQRDSILETRLENSEEEN